MQARDLMTGFPALVTGDDTLMTAADLMRTRCVGMLPVVDSLTMRRPIGVITDRDIAVRAVAFDHGGYAKVREHMTHDGLVFVAATASVDEVAEKMRRHQVRRLPVVDARGSVIGVVAQADLALHVGPNRPDLVEWTIEGISRPGQLVET